MTDTSTTCDLPVAPVTTHAAVLVSPAIAAAAVEGGARFIDVRSEPARAGSRRRRSSPRTPSTPPSPTRPTPVRSS
jgi:hypothetical protein